MGRKVLSAPAFCWCFGESPLLEQPAAKRGDLLKFRVGDVLEGQVDHDVRERDILVHQPGRHEAVMGSRDNGRSSRCGERGEGRFRH
eukprot:726436-Prymnesium_polylepis.1